MRAKWETVTTSHTFGSRELYAREVTGDERDSHLFRIELDSGGMIDLRWRDLRLLFE